MSTSKNQKHTWKTRLHTIIYEADTAAGKLFDVLLLVLIFVSIILVMLESVDTINNKYHTILVICEWVITILFTVEYILRIIAVKQPRKYIFSFYGIIDLLSTLPMYLSYFIVGSNTLVVFRALRLMRVFRILKLTRYVGESSHFMRALIASRIRIFIFIFFVLIICIILGSVMYLIEYNENSGFSSIPKSVYWAIVTLTTVGYGDISPITPLGQFIASVIMILGYGIIAIPTGIITSEMSKTKHKTPTNTQSCSNCLEDEHLDNAMHCHNCGHKLN